MRCGGCGVVYYCSIECRNGGWKAHKPECAAMKEKKARDKDKEMMRRREKEG